MIPEVEWWDVLLRLAVAAGLTGVIGLERELRERAAGLRTHMLVGVGSALFTIVSAYGWASRHRSSRASASSAPGRSSARASPSAG